MKSCNPYALLQGFTHVNISKSSPMPGLYSFWYNRKCIYVGIAEKQSIRERLLQHWNNCHNEGLRRWIRAKGSTLSFCYVEIPVRQLRKAERYHIHRLQPLTNIQLSKCQVIDET